MTGTLEGRVDGCTVFLSDDGGTRWVLVGDPAVGLEEGTAYAVSGVALDAMAPQCPQGLPFHVTSIEPRATPTPS